MRKSQKLPSKSRASIARMTLHELAKEIRRVVLSTKKGNMKLGETYSWSLPPISTCPGRTELCEDACYDWRLWIRRSTVQQGRLYRYELTLHPMFAEALKLTLKTLPASLLRVHVGGDFYSPAYTKAWIGAVSCNPHIKAFAFTRSWRVAGILKTLQSAKFPSWILASTDAMSGPAPFGMREARMNSTKKRDVLSGKAAAPAGTCPEQTGLKDGCDSCGRCPMARVVPGIGIQLMPTAAKAGVLFLAH